VRYNAYFNNSSDAFDLATYSGLFTAAANYTYIYNNTFFHNGWYQKLPYEEYRYADPINFGYIGNDIWPCYSSVLKNNLFYNNANVHGGYDVYESGNGSPLSWVTDPEKGNVTIENNYNDGAGENTNPLFIDTTLDRPDSWILPDLNLQANSPAIDRGTYLTQANGSGSATTALVVDDARYFQDGNFGIDTLAWPSSVKIYADWIAIGTCENIVQIKSIDYSTNTITLESPMTWEDRTPIWLYKISDGTTVLNGNASDMGAYEYVEGGTYSPINLQPNYPNPFNKTTTINYTVTNAGNIKLIIYDILGREIRTLVDEYQTAGPQKAEWDGTDKNSKRVPSGTYFYQIRWENGEASSKKMIFLK
jgi:hypothetical protein